MKYTVTPRILKDGNIEIETSIDNELAKHIKTISTVVIDMQNQAVRAALMNLGWTPPPKESAFVKALKKDMDRVQAIIDAEKSTKLPNCPKCGSPNCIHNLHGSACPDCDYSSPEDEA
jgi:ribosomal protein L32|tara:strand:- start:6024 stop:6377 length:354 start_codon:yes stop_codon:yes gene_type:complete